MSAGTLGDFLLAVHADPAWRLPPAAIDASRWPAPGEERVRVAVENPAPGVWLAHSGATRVLVQGGRGGLGLVHEPGASSAAARARAADDALRAGVPDPAWQPDTLRGRFVLVFWDSATQSVRAFTDLFRTHALFHRVDSDRVLIASDLRLILAAAPGQARVDRVALYHYLNFAYVPSPSSAVQGVAKLEPGYRLDARPGTRTRRAWTDARYAEDRDGPEGELVAELRDRIVANVRDYRPDAAAPWGTFLSGGTDSSSIAGILAGIGPVESFSIGFAEGGFDEMAFSRIAARRFGLQAHERFVGEEDSVAAVPRLVRAFDEPFGNSSAIPTYYCAELARAAGKEVLVAGDGGDEIFGGNERYAKDYLFGRYHHAPAPVRWAGAALAAALSGIDTSLTNRIRNMVRRGAMPNPERFYSDDAFASNHFTEMLTPEFREGIAPEASLDVQRELFERPGTESELHRLMYLDLKMTLAESDVVKVVRSARMAGVDVAFPYLDRALVDYTGRLPDRYKVMRTAKRYLFKKAMADILPAEIRRKKKQGFGLPVSVWLRRPGPMRELVNDVVASPRALARGYFDPAFVRRLITRHEAGVWDYSSEIFRLLMLELWHREHLDDRA